MLKKIQGYARLEVAAALGAIAILVVAGALLSGGLPGRADTAKDPPCYSVTDRAGNTFHSYYPPIPASDLPGTYAYNDDHDWGFVFGAVSMNVDRDCLRERGVDVPPLRKSEEAP